MYPHLRIGVAVFVVLLSTWVFATGANDRQTVASIAQGTPATDDTFRFRVERSQLLSLVLVKVNDTIEMTWPEITGSAWDTALLGVSLNPNAAVSEPFVEIAIDGMSHRQHVPAGDAGPRWLNLSFLRGRLVAGTRVTVRGEGVSVSPGDALLRLFANRLDLSRSMLVLAPHPDDAEIAAFGLYADRRATIVTVTAGNAGPPSYRSLFSDLPELYQFKGRIRLIDSITVPWQGGIPPDRAFNLGYFDARLLDMHESPDTVIPEMYGPNTDIGVYRRHNIGTLLDKRPRTSSWRHLVDDIEQVLKKVRPEVIVAPHPQLDTHRDHKFTTVALAEALMRWKRPVDVLLYTNHADRNRYPYGPAGTIMSLPPPLPEQVVLERVYSHPLSIEQQRAKLFALDSMHDLRASPSHLYRLVIGDDARADVDPPPDGVGYFRRGVRSNEIFFVYDRDGFRQMMETFLDTWRASARTQLPG